MKIKKLLSLEQRIRDLRDDYLIKPIIKSKKFNRHATNDLSGGIKDFKDHKVAFYFDDHIIGGSIRRTDGWAKNETLKVCNMVETKSIFIDVGANIGTQTIYALLFGGFERAICFEPLPKNARMLRANLALNDLLDRVTVIEAAAGGSPGRATLNLSRDNGGAHSILHEKGATSIEISVVTVEETLERLNVPLSEISLCWIDVEGYEGEVFKGWPSLKGRPTAVEYTPEIAKLTNADFSGWKEWAFLDENPIQWSPIGTLNIPAIKGQVDLLLR